jgi:hypothetical protein
MEGARANREGLPERGAKAGGARGKPPKHGEANGMTERAAYRRAKAGRMLGAQQPRTVLT